MSTFLSVPSAYGQTQPLIPVLPLPVASDSVPGVETRGVLGQINIVANTAYMLIGIIDGAAQWVALGGADGNFNALVVTTSITAGTTITAGGNIVSTAGNIQALGGFIDATGNISSDAELIAGTDVTAFGSVYIAGDSGVAAAGAIGLTNALDDTQGAGDLTIKSTTGNPGDNTGFIKAYIGGVTIWIPYFADIAP